MFPNALAGARAVGLALLAVTLFTACGSDDSAQTPTATPAAYRLVVDTGSAAPVAGGTLTLKATLLAADGTEIKGASFAWTSSDTTVATVVSASDKAPAASASIMTPVGTYATIQTLAAGTADITATATLASGSQVTSVTHLVVQTAPAKTYTLVLTPATVAVTAGGASQTVTVAVRRSDGVDGVGDLTNWSWTSDDASFVATPAVDGRSAQVASPLSATAVSAAMLTACADLPTGGRLCANAAMTRGAAPTIYTVGGTVAGLASGKSLQLADTNGDTQVISADGGFAMPALRAAGTGYGVTVAGQPAGQTCTVANGAGTVVASNVTSIAITCVQAQFVVIANRDDSTLSVYRIDPASGALAVVSGSPFAAAGQVNDIAFMPDGQKAYTTLAEGKVAGFSLDAATGAMARVVGEEKPTASIAAIAIHPSGKWLTVGGVGSLASFSIDANGLGSQAPGVAFADAGTTSGIAVSPNGQQVFASNTDAGDLVGSAFDTATGTFTPSGVYSAGGASPSAAVLSPDGAHLYTPNAANPSIGVATLDSSSGQIWMTTSYPTPASGAVDIAVTPSGRFAYALGSGTDNNIARYWIRTAEGDLSWSGFTATGKNGQRLRIEPNGRYLYAPSLNGTVYAFAIDDVSGVLTTVPGSPFAAGSGNVAIAIVEPKP